MNYGLKLKRAKKYQWITGSGRARAALGADADIINKKGDWLWSAPKEEQNRFGFETFNCTVYATYKALIALARFKGYGDFVKTASERYGGVVCETGPAGNDPWNVAELTATMFGLVPDERLPWTDQDTPQEYFSPKPMDEKIVQEGQQLLAKYQIEPEWVFPPFSALTPKQKQVKLQEALRRGTVVASVRAWERNGNTYTKTVGAADNHLVWIPRYDGDRPQAHDQYQPFLKTLERDYDFNCAIVFFMRPNPTGKPPHILKYASWLLSRGRFTEALSVLTKPFMPTNTPASQQNTTSEAQNGPTAPVTPPAAVSNREHLYATAKSLIGRRMSVDHFVPNSVACVVSMRGVLKEALGYDPAPGVANTNGLNTVLAADPRFKAVLTKELEPGDIIIALTQGNTHGHTWIRGRQDSMSNDSTDGIWKANYTNDAVFALFRDKLGLTMRCYRAV